ncbi:MAG: ABC transporter ATP-binding protein [Methanofollis sp.]|uniref:ABC transporter ATP-binding protein n=1 Tax=Methanofollis sp. TaxID=2052835 RepID=UPI0026030491|nr:ABC transporter ATP-binding protein [Methanofollis sp.]MDD4255303.1 ABC transporter ATP-binding protein [Methanofollis sp.]
MKGAAERTGRSIAFVREVLAAPQKTEFRYRDLRFFLPYLRPVWKLGAVSLAITMVLVGLRALVPLSGKIFLDYLVPGAGAAPPTTPFTLSLPTLLLAMLVLGAAVGVLGLLQTYLLVRFREEYTFGLQADLFDHVLRFPLPYFKAGQTGYLMSRISGDVGVMQYLFSQFLPQIISNVFYVAFSLVILYALSARLTLLLIVFTPLFLLANLVFLSRIRAVTYQEREREAHVSRDLQEVLAGIETVKAHAAEEREVGRVVATLRGVIRMRVRNAMLASFSGQALLGTQFLLLLAVVWVGGQEVIAGAMTVGGFVAYIAYIVTFSAAARTFFSLPVVLQPVVTSAERLRELFGTETEAAGLAPATVAGRIAFQDVSFSYPDGTEVLRDVSFTVGPGEVVALVGRTGAGKTTLINLVLRFYSPTAGTVTLDGRDLADLDPRWVREQVSVVSQDLFLFHTSVEENIRYGRPEAGRDEVVAAAEKAQVHEEVLGFPHGYETVVGERGMQLSTGQRQRIAVARAFLRDSTILILDEPTSALDARTEERLQASLADLAEGRTVVMITHRTALLALADRVYAIEDGRLVERAAAGEVG